MYRKAYRKHVLLCTKPAVQPTVSASNTCDVCGHVANNWKGINIHKGMAHKSKKPILPAKARTIEAAPSGMDAIGILIAGVLFGAVLAMILSFMAFSLALSIL